MERATVGGGCFWCLEPVFEGIEGVLDVEPGYAGGWSPNPTYREVCSGRSGHAEVVQITFDPAVLPYERLLRVFFTAHDPTTLNRQGADEGPQYRSIVLFHDPAQEETARDVIRALEREELFDDPIVTEVVPLETFHRAESEHHGYYRRNPSLPFCRIVITPKVNKVRNEFRSSWRSDPDSDAPTR